MLLQIIIIIIIIIFKVNSLIIQVDECTFCV